MSTTAQIEKAIKSVIESATTSTTATLGPARYPAGAQAALRRCCAAWKRAFNAYMENTNLGYPPSEIGASQSAGEAYRNAMPLLVGYEGARDFIACTAYGILVGAIPKEESGQLLYAAQVALSIAQSQSRVPKIPAVRAPKSTYKSAKKPASECATPPLPPAKVPNRVGRKRRSELKSAA